MNIYEAINASLDAIADKYGVPKLVQPRYHGGVSPERADSFRERIIRSADSLAQLLTDPEMNDDPSWRHSCIVNEFDLLLSRVRDWAESENVRLGLCRRRLQGEK